jgi:hypothetical protein
MKLVCEYPAGTLRTATTANNNQAVAQAVKSMPGVGKPFLIFATLPGTVIFADLEMYPDYVVSTDVAANLAKIEAMLSTPPLDALTFAE